MIGFGFTSDWLRMWCEIFKLITNRSNAKPKLLLNYFEHSIEKCSNCPLFNLGTTIFNGYRAFSLSLMVSNDNGHGSHVGVPNKRS